MKHFFTALLILSFISTTLAQSAATCGFSHKKIITINGTQITGGPHTNFPVLISHTDADLTAAAGKVQSASGFDIIFCDAQANLLDFQLENYNSATGEYVAWVKIPSITNGADVDIHMLYGKAAIVTDQSTTTTWSAGYNGIWHLNGDENDNSGNGYNSTNNGSTNLAGNGFTADGQDFQDPNDWLELNSGTSFPNISTGSFTITGWINSNDVTRGGQRIFCDDASNANGGFSLSLGDGGAGRLRFYVRGTSPLILDSPNGIIANGTWYHVAIVQDAAGTRRTIYVDGASVANTGAATIPATADPGNSSIGGEVSSGESSNRFHGTLDEIRAFSGVLSANWIATEYSSQNQPIAAFPAVTAGDFYAVSAEVDLQPIASTGGDWDDITTWGVATAAEIPDIGAIVVINEQVTLGATDADHLICSCTISNSTGNVSELTVNSTRSLEVIQDVTVSAANTANNTKFIVGGSADVDISGDLDLTRIASNNRTNLCILEMTGTATVDVTGNMDWDYLNSANGESGNEVFMDGGTLTVVGDFNVDHDDGGNFKIQMDDGTINIGGNFNHVQDGGTLFRVTLSNAADFNVAGDMIIDHNAARANNSDIDYILNNASRLDISGEFNMNMNETLRNTSDIRLTTNNTSQINVGTAGGGNENLTLTVVDGDFTRINMTGQSQINVLDGDLDIDHAGDGNCDVLISASGAANTATFTVSDDIHILKTDGDRLLVLVRGAGTLDVNGNVDISTTAFDGNSVHTRMQTQNTAVADIEGDLSISQNSPTNNHLRLVATNTSRIDVGNGNDNLTLNLIDGNRPDITVGNGGVINVFGDLDYVFTGGSAGTVPRVYLNNAASELNVTGNLDFNHVQGADEIHVRLNNGATLNVDGNIDMQDVNAAGLLRFDVNNDSKIEIGGNFVRDNTAGQQFGTLQMDNNAMVEYNGTAAQEIAEDAGDGGDSFTYTNLIINNTFGTSPQLTLEGVVQIEQLMTFTDGVVATSAANILEFIDGADASAALDGSHVDGPVRKVGNDDFVFPVGDLGIWAAIEIDGLSGTTTFEAQYFHANHGDHLDKVGLANVSTIEYWNLDRTGAVESANVTLHWGSMARSFIDDGPDLRVAHYNAATTWEDYGQDAINFADPGSITVNAVNVFSPFTFGSLSNIRNPLPVELVSFDAKLNGDKVDLTWETATETHNDYFLVERSADGHNWERVLTMDGAGNSVTAISYMDVDYSPLKGVSYYRLTQFDFDGGSETFNIVPVEYLGNNEPGMHIFPNPVSSGDQTNIQLTDFGDAEILVVLRDITGKQFYSKVVIVENGDALVAVDIDSSIPSGTYLVTASSENRLHSRKLIIQ